LPAIALLLAVSRSVRLLAISLAILAFLAISVVLARWLSAENAERDAIYDLLRAQARGDTAAMLARLPGCAARPACRAAVQADASRLRGGGDLKILTTTSHTAYALAGATGKTRVAWKVPSHLPVVQCVLVRRTGDVLSGMSVTLLDLGPPIPGTSEC
jgi:hypothetical protein